MDRIRYILKRFWPTGALFVIGFILIIYIACGILYLQQGAQQKGLEEQIVKLGLITSKPLPSGEALQAEYDAVSEALSPITLETALEIIVDIASQSGIDIDPYNYKFHIPPAKVEKAKVGEGGMKMNRSLISIISHDKELLVLFGGILLSGMVLIGIAVTVGIGYL